MKLIFTYVLVFTCEIRGFASDCLPSASPPDPETGCCGRAVNGANKKVGSSVDVNEYPWMGLVEYEVNRGIKCSAVLISARYALSSAVCFSLAAIKSGNATHIRLGEYDVNNEGPDCVEVKPGQRNCTDGAIRIPIEKYFVHPDFNYIKKRGDIALVKLAKAAPYTDSIRPICLPTLDVTIQHPKQFYMTVAGWGAVNTTVRSSHILRQVLVPYVDTNICHSKYMAISKIEITNGHICAGSKNRDSCSGDIGGPLMYRKRNITEVAGLVSFGPTPCGTGIPGVYTKIFAYKEWIHKTIEAEENKEVATKATIDTDIIYFKE